MADDDSDVEFDDTEAEEADADDAGDEEAEEQPEAAKPGPKKEPAVAKEDPEILRLRAALKKANEDGKKNRLTLKELEERGRANEGDHDRALREAREEAEGRWKPRIVNQAARAALAEAGVAGGPDRVLRLLDLDALSVDDDGDVVGLDSEVSRLKDDYPEFFAKAEERPRPKARPTGAPKPPAPDKPKSAAEQHAARVLNGN
ncbi:phage scaffolding protein [Kitasatospora sp. NPDC057223]|uniref:phage scaffolding protein n=1 Tax=Kitasatospora sp. NPDC057223 TaxID=3346055 RepID=UPI00362E4518